MLEPMVQMLCLTLAPYWKKKINRLSLILLNSYQITYGLRFSYNVTKKLLH